MVHFTKDGEPFITAGERSRLKYAPELTAAIKEKFGAGRYTEKSEVTEILNFSYHWVANKFVEIIHARKNLPFVYYLFSNHESSIKIYLKQFKENIEVSEGISENTLALNRRILKLALEQTCDVDYSFKNDEDLPMTQAKVREYAEAVEDLLYLGDRLFGFSEHLAEQRMIEECIEINLNGDEMDLGRQHHYDDIYPMITDIFKEGFRNGIMDNNVVPELRDVIKRCMGIDYDFAGVQIFQIKEHHAKGSPTHQTIQPDVLVENLVHSGVDGVEAQNFYDGLTVSRSNKLSITDSVYLSNSMKRYMFRPILILHIDGEPRALVGEQKWSESITTMATNGFQWQVAPEEWKLNQCFREYLERKADEHDKLLEEEAIVLFKKRGVYYDRNTKQLTPSKGNAVSIDNKTCGEIDFLLIDLDAKKIFVSDCKYHRARYEMVGFSGDFSNFRREYEPKMAKKIKFIEANLQLVKEHFQRFHGLPDIDLRGFTIEGLFIVNTPTFYMLNGKYNTVTASILEDFISEGYQYPDATINNYPGAGDVKIIKHPYFTVQ